MKKKENNKNQSKRLTCFQGDKEKKKPLSFFRHNNKRNNKLFLFFSFDEGSPTTSIFLSAEQFPPSYPNNNRSKYASLLYCSLFLILYRHHNNIVRSYFQVKHNNNNNNRSREKDRLENERESLSPIRCCIRLKEVFFLSKERAEQERGGLLVHPSGCCRVLNQALAAEAHHTTYRLVPSLSLVFIAPTQSKIYASECCQKYI